MNFLVSISPLNDNAHTATNTNDVNECTLCFENLCSQLNHWASSLHLHWKRVQNILTSFGWSCVQIHLVTVCVPTTLISEISDQYSQRLIQVCSSLLHLCSSCWQKMWCFRVVVRFFSSVAVVCFTTWLPNSSERACSEVVWNTA